MILVLLYRFSESQDSIIGYRLCEILAQEGHHLLVTSTSNVEERDAERKAAHRMTQSYKGSVELIEPESEELEKPSPEWIAKLHKTYFGQMAELQNVQMIIGTLPGTSKTAVELKKILNCRLILLATTKVPADEKLKKEVRKFTSYADEVWSMGSDIYSHYDEIFHEQPAESKRQITHTEIMLKPDVKSGLKSVDSDESSQNPIESDFLASIWNREYPYYFKGKEKCAMGSKNENFSVLCSALQNINKEKPRRLHWHINGLKWQGAIIKDILGSNDQNLLRITDFPSASFLKDLTMRQCLAFIAPDIQDDRFNFLALTAMSLEIPTLVSAESTVGKFLQTLDTPLKQKVLVDLTGDNETDKEVWIKKIKEELMNEKENPKMWAKELSQYLQSNNTPWKLNLSALSSPFVPFIRPFPWRGSKRGAKLKSPALTKVHD